MKQLTDFIVGTYVYKYEHVDGNIWVVFNHNGKDYQRQVKYKYFSNFPIEYVNFKGTQYQVNTVKSVSV